MFKNLEDYLKQKGLNIVQGQKTKHEEQEWVIAQATPTSQKVRVISITFKKDQDATEHYNNLQKIENMPNQNIAKISDLEKVGNKIYYSQEYYQDNLQQRLNESKGKQIEQQKKMAVGLLRAIIYLQDQNIIHHNIKPSNILIDKEHNIKLADLYYKGKSFKNKETDKLYLAPEQLELDGERGQAKESDFYSVGAILCKLYGFDYEKHVEQIQEGNFPGLSDAGNKEVKEFFHLMVISTSRRFMPEEILQSIGDEEEPKKSNKKAFGQVSLVVLILLVALAMIPVFFQQYKDQSQEDLMQLYNLKYPELFKECQTNYTKYNTNIVNCAASYLSSNYSIQYIEYKEAFFPIDSLENDNQKIEAKLDQFNEELNNQIAIIKKEDTVNSFNLEVENTLTTSYDQIAYKIASIKQYFDGNNKTEMVKECKKNNIDLRDFQSLFKCFTIDNDKKAIYDKFQIKISSNNNQHINQTIFDIIKSNIQNTDFNISKHLERQCINEHNSSSIEQSKCLIEQLSYQQGILCFYLESKDICNSQDQKERTVEDILTKYKRLLEQLKTEQAVCYQRYSLENQQPFSDCQKNQQLKHYLEEKYKVIIDSKEEDVYKYILKIFEESVSKRNKNSSHQIKCDQSEESKRAECILSDVQSSILQLKNLNVLEKAQCKTKDEVTFYDQCNQYLCYVTEITKVKEGLEKQFSFEIDFSVFDNNIYDSIINHLDEKTKNSQQYLECREVSKTTSKKEQALCVLGYLNNGVQNIKRQYAMYLSESDCHLENKKPIITILSSQYFCLKQKKILKDHKIVIDQQNQFQTIAGSIKQILSSTELSENIQKCNLKQSDLEEETECLLILLPIYRESLEQKIPDKSKCSISTVHNTMEQLLAYFSCLNRQRGSIYLGEKYDVYLDETIADIYAYIIETIEKNFKQYNFIVPTLTSSTCSKIQNNEMTTAECLLSYLTSEVKSFSKKLINLNQNPNSECKFLVKEKKTLDDYSEQYICLFKSQIYDFQINMAQKLNLKNPLYSLYKNINLQAFIKGKTKSLLEKIYSYCEKSLNLEQGYEDNQLYLCYLQIRQALPPSYYLYPFQSNQQINNLEFHFLDNLCSKIENKINNFNKKNEKIECYLQNFALLHIRLKSENIIQYGECQNSSNQILCMINALTCSSGQQEPSDFMSSDLCSIKKYINDHYDSYYKFLNTQTDIVEHCISTNNDNKLSTIQKIVDCGVNLIRQLYQTFNIPIPLFENSNFPKYEIQNLKLNMIELSLNYSQLIDNKIKRQFQIIYSQDSEIKDLFFKFYENLINDKTMEISNKQNKIWPANYVNSACRSESLNKWYRECMETYFQKYNQYEEWDSYIEDYRESINSNEQK